MATMLAASTSVAQWHADSVTNTPVCVVTGLQDYPKICSDGADGAIIVWEDARNGAYEIFAQHINQDGRTTWAQNGVRLSTGTTNDQRYPIIASDGSGGAYVVWQDYRNVTNGVSLYGTHILANGSLAYPASGALVATGAQTDALPVICSDGAGGAFVAWTSSAKHVYANALGSSGVRFGGGITVNTWRKIQRNPAICADGSGGCYIAWESTGEIPTAICAQHVSSGGSLLWGSSAGPGVIVFEDYPNPNYPTQPEPDAGHVSVSLDKSQLLLAWQEINPNSNDQNILAMRMRCSSPTDTAKVWYTSMPYVAVQVTGDWPYDQFAPQIYSDDSVNSALGARGILVPFLDVLPPGNDYTVDMERVLGDGSFQVPNPQTSGFWHFALQPNAKSNLRTVKLDTGTHTSILAVWNDARYAGSGKGNDTTIFAQRIDRVGRKYFPTPSQSNTKGMPICSGTWQAREVCLAPRSDGAIAAWSDMRNGNGDIYAQLILMDGSLSNGLNARPMTTIVSQKGSYDGSECNAKVDSILAIDTGAHAGGIASITPTTISNMRLATKPFVAGADTVHFALSVIDSFQSAYASIAIQNNALNVYTADFNYCPLPDTIAPVVTWDTVSNWLQFHFTDKRPWDRGLGSIRVTDSANVVFSPSLSLATPGISTFNVIASRWDLSQPAHFCIQVSDTAGNTTQNYCFTKSLADVLPDESPVSLLIYPNPVTSSAMLTLTGIGSAEVTVLDMLGRTVDRFHMDGSYEWATNSFPAGSYLVRASANGRTFIQHIVIE